MAKRRRDRTKGSPFELGSREWLALPDLGLPAVKAKVDTGARTSALHASRIERVDGGGEPRLRFVIRPVPHREDIELVCEAPLMDSREVTSSNGEREMRHVIETTAEMGGRRWPIQVSLTNRERMTYRMLLGRQAIEADMVVMPNRSFLNPRLGYHLYRGLGALRKRDSLRLAMLVRPSPAHADAVAAFIAAANSRQHQVIQIDPSAITLGPGTEAASRKDNPADAFDAVLPWLPAATIRDLAVLRQFQLFGAFAVNSADALLLAGDELRTRQLLARTDVRDPSNDLPASGAMAVVAGGRLVFAVADGGPDQTLNPLAVGSEDQALIEAAARVLGLGLCRVEYRPADLHRGQHGSIRQVAPVPRSDANDPGGWFGTTRRPIPAELAQLMNRIVEFIELSVRGKTNQQGGRASAALPG